ncbi:tetratricopeptide repeat protein [uncultured Proteiniphilum sp.]|uniref:tetratricopeptide repeat protein n=1 Tax=uncultured Proteiniphilum sp. TaxID=497637 RepID=UPI0026331AB1|nr:tetratricopeptide repeat protein [uncultured Proteiniphilum sp.]
MKRGRFFSIHVLMFFCLYATGQTLDDAKNWYQEGRYTEALPVFQTEYLNNPNNPSVNQWLGVCLYETGRIPEAQKYLEFASERKIPEAYIYLGELYTKMYRFEDAGKEFEKYQRAKRRDSEALEILDQKRSYAERLQRAVNRTEDLQIIDSLVVPKSDFLSAYNLSASSGSLIPVNEFFPDRSVTKETLYMNERQDKIYYSGGDAVTGTDLFTMDKLLDIFGNEKKLPETINQGGNQAFPFVLNDGMTLYFASTDDPSFGGYDLFVTRYNLTSDSYLTPNQLNMPFNSPFNDYMMAMDEEKGIGWFASDRFQPADSVCIYTFIPNPQVQLVESDDAGYLARRAQISSIADTWKGDTNYEALRSLAQQKTVIQQETEGDFTFMINDQATYHTLSDFRNERARSLFSQALGYEEQLQVLNGELSQKRDQFTGGQMNDALATSILKLEKETESLFRETERLKMQARNEEIRTHFNQY